MNDGLVKTLSSLHRVLFRLTGGRLGKRLVDNDMLLLSTTGRRSGKEHTVPLLYLGEGERLVVIASFGGRPQPPDWYLNLVAEPRVRVQTRDGSWRGVASTASPEDRARWWPMVIDAYAGYSYYQSRTDREIPVVFIDPLPA